MKSLRLARVLFVVLMVSTFFACNKEEDNEKKDIPNKRITQIKIREDNTDIISISFSYSENLISNIKYDEIGYRIQNYDFTYKDKEIQVNFISNEPFGNQTKTMTYFIGNDGYVESYEDGYGYNYKYEYNTHGYLTLCKRWNDNTDWVDINYTYDSNWNMITSRFDIVAYSDIPNISGLYMTDDYNILDWDMLIRYTGLLGKPTTHLPKSATWNERQGKVYTDNYSYILDEFGYVTEITIINSTGDSWTEYYTYEVY